MIKDYDTRIKNLNTQLEAKQSEVATSTTRAQDELCASAVNTRQYQVEFQKKKKFKKVDLLYIFIVYIYIHTCICVYI